MLLTQPSGDEHIEEQLTFPKLKKTDIKNSDLPDVPIHSYSGPKKPSMPANILQKQVHSLKHLAHQEIIKQRGQQLDFELFKSIATNPKTPEYSGYKNCYVHELGALKGKKTIAVYTPVIDLTLSDPTTIMTAMTEARRITNSNGQKHMIFTCDQQLYKLFVDIKWVYPEIFPNFIPRFGGMHLLMSFKGCIGTLTANKGLEEILNKTFSSVKKILSGKKFPMNL